MKIILAKGGVEVKVDDEDFEELSKHNWYLTKPKGYVMCTRWKPFLMHRFVMKAKKGQLVDHINRDKLDNRKSNLRICTTKENCRNAGLSKNNKTGYIGVSPNNRTRNGKKWGARYECHITVNYKKIFLGYYDDPIVAAKVRDQAAIKYHGAFAGLNFPPEHS